MIERNQRLRKELFAPLPIRAVCDARLSARHLRVLAAVCYHDRFGRNGQGCWAGRKRLAAETGITSTHVSDMLSDLRRFGYVTSERHPMNQRTTVHRVIYDDSDRSPIRDPLQTAETPDRSRLRVEQVPSQKANALGMNGKGVSNILGINLRIDSAEAEAATKVEIEKRNCAEARTAEEVRVEIEVEAEAYLSEVELFAADKTTISALRCEHPRLSQIASDERVPAEMRSRAARLRDIASDARQ